METYMNIVKENIEYDVLVNDCDIGEREYIDEIVNVLAETVGVEREKVSIGRVEYPYGLVRGRLLKLDMMHVRYVLECLKRTTKVIRNIKAYMLTCLFNAPVTMNSYYRSRINAEWASG